MKEIKFSGAAESALADIFEYSITEWGIARAEAYKDQLLMRLMSLARDELPHARPCEALMRGRRDATGLKYAREGGHAIVIRETATTIEVVDFIHQRRDLGRLIDMLVRDEKQRKPDE